MFTPPNPEHVVCLPAKWLVGPPPPDSQWWLVAEPDALTDPQDLPATLTAADSGMTWRLWPFLYIWETDHYRVYRGDLACP